jgi:hypothetical protein
MLLSTIHKICVVSKKVIFTNESNIDRFTKARAKAIDSKLGRLEGFMKTVKLPIQVSLALLICIPVV